jgi:hypothetical protein
MNPAVWLQGQRMRIAALCACTALGCDDGRQTVAADGDAGVRRVKERTVRIGLLRVGERELELGPDGTVTYPEVIHLGGVEVCIARQRSAFDSFGPFTELEPPGLCVTSMATENTQHEGVPANSDLIITYTKRGYEPVTTTFRTDEHDVAVPGWAENLAYFVPLLAEGSADPWIEDEPAGDDSDGMLAIWVVANGEWGSGHGVPVFGADADPGVDQGRGVRVEISDADGLPVADLETLDDRPLFVRVPEGSYRLRFSHRIGEVVPVGVQEQFMITGLPTDAYDTIEVPVLAGRLALAALEMYCPLPRDDRPFEDVSTCTLAQAENQGPR